MKRNRFAEASPARLPFLLALGLFATPPLSSANSALPEYCANRKCIQLRGTYRPLITQKTKKEEGPIQILKIHRKEGDGYQSKKYANNEPWIGLFCDAGTCRTKDVSIKVEDRIIEEASSIEVYDGIQVSLAESPLPTLLIKGIAKLKAGVTLPNATVGKVLSKTGNEMVRSIQWGDREYKLKTIVDTKGYNAKGVSTESIQVTFKTVIVYEGKTQTIGSTQDRHHYASGKKDAIEKTLHHRLANQIHFFGDLDGDKKPDFFTNACLRESEFCFESTLYLSSLASLEEIAGKAASYQYWDPGNPGC